LKNEYKTFEDYAIIYLYDKNKKRYDLIVDIEDFNLLYNLTYSWHLFYNKSNREYYAKSTMYLGSVNGKGKYKVYFVHQYLFNKNKENELTIDHVDHNPLNNRRENIRFITNENNLKNRGKLNNNNKSGYRNVSWNKSINKWIVQLQINRKNTVLGEFDFEELDKAGAFAKEMRELYYKEFKGI